MSRVLTFALLLAVLDVAFSSAFFEHKPESWFKANNIRKLEETTTTGAAGYVIQTFYSDTKCGANAVSQIGYLTDSCITTSTSATTSMKYSFTKGDCSDLTLSYYSDGTCGTLSASYPYSTFAMCNAIASLGGQSMSGSCQVGTSYPKFPTHTTVNLVYPNAAGCNDPAGTFEVFPLDTCMVAGNTATEYHCADSITLDSYTTNSCGGAPSNVTTYPQACTKVINSSPQQFLKTYCN